MSENPKCLSCVEVGDDSDLEVSLTDTEELDNDENTPIEAISNNLNNTSPLFDCPSSFKRTSKYKKDEPKERAQFVESLWKDQIQVSHEGFQFTGPPPGPTKTFQTPLEVFETFFTENMFELIEESSNLYIRTERYRQKYQSRTAAFDGVRADDIRRYLIVMILISLHNKNQIKSNWSKNPLLYTPIFGSIMSYNHFIYIQSALHFSTDGEENETDKIWKIRRFFEMLNCNFSANYNLNQEISIDESLKLWRGNHALRR